MLPRATHPQTEPEELESELAAALPGRRAHPITRAALHVVPFILLAVATFVLWREFHDLNPRDVAAAMRAWGYGAIITALGLSAASFLLMGATEWLGLRWTGARLPLRVTLSGSFLANSIAHSLGANLLVSGAIRARLYGRYGVGLKQVAATTLFSGFAFGVGLSTLAGAGLLFSSRDELAAVALQPDLAHALGGMLISGAMGYVVLCATLRRRLSAFGHSLQLPSVRQAAGQVVIGVSDNAIAAAIIWTLLPDDTLSYLSFVGAYAIAVVAGLASTVPGGAGVFEGSLSTLLPSASRAPLVAALLGYRLVYYLLPLLVGVLALAGDTMRRRTEP